MRSEFTKGGRNDRRGHWDAMPGMVRPLPSGKPPAIVAHSAKQRLFTAVALVLREGRLAMLFYGSVAAGEEEFRATVTDRFGATVAANALVAAGFDSADDLVAGLIGPAAVAMLGWLADDPESPLAADVEVHCIQRIGA